MEGLEIIKICSKGISQQKQMVVMPIPYIKIYNLKN